MNLEVIKVAMQFMQRVNLNAQEIPTWNQVMQEMAEYVQANEVVPEIPTVEKDDEEAG
jgi:hypothetical protein